jgi:hypothetical protein
MIQIDWFVLYVWWQWELCALASKNLKSRNSTGDCRIGICLLQHVETANWKTSVQVSSENDRNWLICCIWIVAVRIAHSQQHQHYAAQFCRDKLNRHLTWSTYKQWRITAAPQVSSYIVTYWLICALCSVGAVQNCIHSCQHQHDAPLFCMYKLNHHPSLRASR